MSQLKPVLIRLPQEVALEVRAHCKTKGLRVSEFLRGLVIEACREGLNAPGTARQLVRIENDLNFTAVALDALLAGHPDPELRTRAHAAFARKSERRHAPDAVAAGAVR